MTLSTLNSPRAITAFTPARRNLSNLINDPAAAAASVNGTLEQHIPNESIVDEFHSPFNDCEPDSFRGLID